MQCHLLKHAESSVLIPTVHNHHCTHPPPPAACIAGCVTFSHQLYMLASSMNEQHNHTSHHSCKSNTAYSDASNSAWPEPCWIARDSGTGWHLRWQTNAFGFVHLKHEVSAIDSIATMITLHSHLDHTFQKLQRLNRPVHITICRGQNI